MDQAQVGKVFALEGTPGSGKTTLLTYLREQYAGNVGLTFLPEAAESIMGIFPLGRRATIETEVALLSREAERVARINELIVGNTHVIADRCWVSNTVLAQVRHQTVPNYTFDPELYAVQERVFQVLYPTLFTNTVLVFLDLPPEATFERQPWRQNLGEWVHITYATYKTHMSYIQEQQPIWQKQVAKRAAAPALKLPPPGIAAPLPEPILSPYAGIEQIDACLPAEQVIQAFEQIFEVYTGRRLRTGG